MYSSHFRVLFGSGHAFAAHPDLLRKALRHPDGAYFGGRSLWIEKVA